MRWGWLSVLACYGEGRKIDFNYGEPMSLVPIRRALISVSDKSGIVELCQVLKKFGVEILSTGGTARTIRDAGIDVKDVSEHTGFPEMMDGRVKTLHPKIHGGLLALRNNDAHMGKASEHDIGMIDMVVVNLYPFQETVAKSDVTRSEAIEQIDIGGPSMVRSAAKNHTFVAILTASDQYTSIMEKLEASKGSLDLETRQKLALAAFENTASYDAAIATWLNEQESSDQPAKTLCKSFDLVQGLRYGENPHQSAAFYADSNWQGTSLANAKQISGKELSYNNILDLESALRLAMEFEEPGAVVVKHNNPCGCALGKTIDEAFVRAYEGDPLSAFGGIVALNRPCDQATATAIIEGQKFLEAIVAPSFENDAVTMITKDNPNKWRKSIRLVETGEFVPEKGTQELRTITGGVLAQSRDTLLYNPDDLNVATKTQAYDNLSDELKFAWKVVKHIKSNAICLTKDRQLVGFGAGQTSRVDAVEIAIRKAGEKAKGSVMASDAFFPFPDSVELAKESGITGIIQPGGSVKDKDVIAAADEASIAMMLTSMRHFRH